MSRNVARTRRSSAMELSEAEDVLQDKVKQLASFFKTSKYTVVYTGAGISTVAGIPDFRGPSGVWTLQAKGQKLAEPDFTKLKPTLSHEVVKDLVETTLVRHIVTQNIDGLHLKSGLSSENLSELHGNFCLETCPICDARYYRPHAVWKGLTAPTTANSTTALRHSNRPSRRGAARPQRSEGKANVTRKQLQSVDHRTGQLCETNGCPGELENSVVLFGEDLPDKEVDSAWEHTQRADLALVLGSSLRVGPACDMPARVVRQGGKLIIVNLQNTPFDSRASLVIHAECDKVMHMLRQNFRAEPLTKENPKSEAGNIFSTSIRVAQKLHQYGHFDDHELQCKEFERSFMVNLQTGITPI